MTHIVLISIEAAVGIWALYLAWEHRRGLRTTVRDLQGIRDTLSTDLQEIRVSLRDLQGIRAALYKDLQEIRDSLSTRYLGEFPNYLENIVKLIAQATESIEIMCDFPAYGRFSSPVAFIDYRKELASKQLAGKEVRVTCLNFERRHDSTNIQFGGEANWAQMKISEKFQKNLDSFLKNLKHPVNAADLDYKGFMGLREAEDTKMLKELAGARVNEVDRPVPVFCWIVDNREAIFAFVGVGEHEHGFYTRDVQFIVALQNYAKGIC